MTPNQIGAIIGAIIGIGIGLIFWICLRNINVVYIEEEENK